MTRKTKRATYFLLGLAISAVLIWVLFRNIDFGKLVQALKGADYIWLVPNVMLIVLTMYLRAWRWKFMIDPIKRVGFPDLLASTCVGFMANNVLPLRLGEFVRAYSLASQDKEITKSASLATIFVERTVFDLGALLIIFGTIVWFSDSLRDQVNDSMIVATNMAIVIALVGLIAMLVMALKPNQVGNLLTRYLFFLPDRVKELIKGVILKFSHGLQFLTDFRAVILVTLHTFLIWFVMGVSNYFVFLAFDFDIPFDASFVLLVVVSIMILAPSTPGFLGVYHSGVVISLSLYGITDERALSCALVLHAAQYITVTLMGFYFLKKRHLSLKTLEEEATEPD
ncbi:MAG: flippase-like domain-containing protein [candidate division Zixibacteria bacterium]|nr:flippase-like domain-containing protein [candidate division Zixibacteria bacterium]